MLNLEIHRLALAIAKKTLDENRFTATQKMMARDKPAFQIGSLVNWTLNRDLDTELSA